MAQDECAVESAIRPHYGTGRVLATPALTYPRGMTSPEHLAIAPEVADALRDGRAVVGLESTLISHGLPYTQNVEVATASEAAIRATGAVPATGRAERGQLLLGLSGDELEGLATAERVGRQGLAKDSAPRSPAGRGARRRSPRR